MPCLVLIGKFGRAWGADFGVRNSEWMITGSLSPDEPVQKCEEAVHE